MNAQPHLATYAGEHLCFERVIADLSRRFIDLDSTEVNSEIQGAQKLVCEALGFDRSSLALWDESAKTFMVTHSWASPGCESSCEFISQNLPWFASKILRGEEVRFSSISELQLDTSKHKETVGFLGPKSSLIFPLKAGGQVFGGLAFGNFRVQCEWSEQVVDRLRFISTIFSNALALQRFTEALLENEERVRLVVESAELSEKALISANARLVEANRQVENLERKLKNESVYLQEEIKVERSHQEIVGQSPAIRRVLMKAEQVAPTDSTVLLLGETGTGKELIASAIHRCSKRKDRLMVKVNCAALPSTLVENELFGREKGAYTGALTREIGRFELAHESTIFLDEIGELPLELQAKLLRVLQEGEFERLGSSKTIRVDARLIVATSRNLEAAVREGKFREDLYYRLNVFPIYIPPLRERREDIPMLTWHFLRDLGGRMGREIETVLASTMNSFEAYSWPGNVRELRNVIERHLITYNGPVFEAELPPMIRPVGAAEDTAVEVERNHILRVLERTAWRIRGRGGAAETLDLKPTTLESRMRRLGIFRQ